ncbi:hypothetical protein RI367_005976 [Sorochytrium milnesiophthora]
MGNGSSTSGQYHYTAPLVSQAKPLAAIAYSFCLPTAVHLTLAPATAAAKARGKDFEVHDATSKTVWFTSEGKLPADTVALHDANDDILLSLKGSPSRSTTAWSRHYIHSGPDPSRLAADIQHSNINVSGSTFHVDVRTLDDRTVRFYCKVPEESYDTFVYLDDPRLVTYPRMIAKLIRMRDITAAVAKQAGPDSIGMVVAANVDIALVTTLAVFMYRRRNKYTDRWHKRQLE